MSRLGLALSLTALALLAACAAQEPQQAPAPVVTAPAPTVVAQPTAAPAAGFGRIESITALAPSAAAGGSAKPLKRVGIKMEDGTLQYVDTAADGLAIGSRVELTRDGNLRHPA
jgi:pectin methylesterase-like acyl-CoA thioesterase